MVNDEIRFHSSLGQPLNTQNAMRVRPFARSWLLNRIRGSKKIVTRNYKIGALIRDMCAWGATLRKREREGENRVSDAVAVATLRARSFEDPRDDEVVCLEENDRAPTSRSSKTL